MKTSVALVVVLAITVLLSVAGAQEVTTIRVADTAVRIPAPEGFFRYDGKHPEVDKIAIRLVGSNRLLAAYSSQEDLKRALNGRYPKLERHFSVQTDPKLEAVAFDSELFGLLKQRMRQDFAAADGFEKYRDTIKEVEADGSAAVALSSLSQRFTGMKIGDVIPLGVFDETTDSICFSMLMKPRFLRLILLNS